MTSIARLGDSSSHGGIIISASDDSFANEIGIARDGDLHYCPKRRHGTTSISPITTKSYVNGRLIITIGAVAGCGAIINTGSSDSFAE